MSKKVVDMTLEQIEKRNATGRVYRDKNREAIAEKKRVYQEQNKATISEKQRAYRERNKATITENQRVYREQNRAELNEKGCVYYAQNTAAVAEYQRVYYEQNKPAVTARQRAYRKANPGKKRVLDQRRRAALKGAIVPGREPTAAELAALVAPGVLCFYCGEQTGKQATTIDHFTPLARGGLHTIDNLIGSCHSCNASKGDKLPDVEWHGPPAHLLRRKKAS